MSVPAPYRGKSEAQYVTSVKNLVVRLGEIIANKPDKYRDIYVKPIFDAAFAALRSVQIIQQVYFNQYQHRMVDYEIRRKHCLEAEGLIDHVATASELYLETIKRHVYQTDKDSRRGDRLYDKACDQEIQIGSLCNECLSLIEGVKKADDQLYKQFFGSPNTGSSDNRTDF